MRVIAERTLAKLKWWGMTPYIAFAWRSPELQNKLYMRGRAKKAGRFITVNPKKIVTNLRGNESKHCLTSPDGEPASEAVDIALVENRKWLPDDDPRWCFVPAAALLGAEGVNLRVGAMWNSPRDWPHIELSR